MSIGTCSNCGTNGIPVKSYTGSGPAVSLCNFCSRVSGLNDPVLQHISFVGNVILQELKKLNSGNLVPVEQVSYDSKFYYKDDLHRVPEEGGNGAVLGISCCVENIQTKLRFVLSWGTLVREVKA